MEKIGICLLFLLSLSQASASAYDSDDLTANKYLLPSPFPVYVLDKVGVTNQPSPGTVQKMLPTDNSYKDVPGCYILCYSHQPGVYAVSSRTYVVGQVRVKGSYVARNCRPENLTIREGGAMHHLQILCAQKFATCRPLECWIGSDSGGWFGLQ